METMTLNGTELHKIAHKSPTATTVATMLALRERSRDSLDLSKAKASLSRQGEKIVDQDYIQFWKDLQSAGVGSIIYGRRGKTDRFRWHYSLKEIAKACIDAKDSEVTEFISKPNPVKKKETPEPIKRQAAPKSKPKEMQLNDKIVYIPVRKDFKVAIRIPGDFTKSDVNFLSEALLECID